MGLEEISGVIPSRVYSIIIDLLPMVIVFCVVMVSVKIITAIYKKEKIVYYKELKNLVYIIYCFTLFQLLTNSDFTSYSNNFIPFREIMRYKITDMLFLRNVIGNILVFVPFGFLVSNMIDDNCDKVNMVTSVLTVIVTSVTVEFIQMFIGRSFDIDDIILNITGGIIGYFLYKIIHNLYKKLPKIFENEYIKLLIVIVFIVIIITTGVVIYEVL